MKEITFTIKVSSKDVKESYIYHMKKSFSYKLVKIAMFTLIPLCFIIFITNPKEQWIFGFLVLLYILLLFVFFPYLINKRANDNYNTEKGFESTINYVVNNEEIIVKGNSFESKNTWDLIYQTVELKNIFLIYTNKIAASIIPKNCIDEETLEAFRELIKQKQLSNKR